MNGTAIYTLVEPEIHDSSKWRRILKEGRVITEPSFTKLKTALSSSRVKLEKRQKCIAIKELSELYNTNLWEALKSDLCKQQITKLYDSLPYKIKRTLLKPSEFSDQFYRFDSCPGNVRVNKIEKIGSYNALAAMILLLRDEKYSLDSFEDYHVHRSTFRLLLSFFQHPSFYHYRWEIWQVIRQNVIRQDAQVLKRMGLDYWSWPMEKIDKIVEEERVILELAIQANIAEDFKDAPLFFFLLYRDEDCKKILQGLKSISELKKTEMMPLDSFYKKFTDNRHRGRSTLSYPTNTFESLAIH